MKTMSEQPAAAPRAGARRARRGRRRCRRSMRQPRVEHVGQQARAAGRRPSPGWARSGPTPSSVLTTPAARRRRCRRRRRPRGALGEQLRAARPASRAAVRGHGVVAAGLAQLPPVEHDAAEPDPDRGQVLDTRCPRASTNTRSDSGSTVIDGRPAPPRPTGADSADQAGLDELGGERPDRAAVEPGQRGQVGPRRRAAHVQQAEQAAEVVPPDLVLRRGGADAPRGAWRSGTARRGRWTPLAGARARRRWRRPGAPRR